jgi:hypothetical protein
VITGLLDGKIRRRGKRHVTLATRLVVSVLLLRTRGS